MKLGLILPSNICMSPYVNNYIKALEKNKIKYEIIFWDRLDLNEEGGIRYSKSNIFSYRYLKIFDYLGFISFLKKKIIEREFSKIIIFSPQLAILLYPFLKKKYTKKFILDIRDLSIEQRVKRFFNKILSISSLNVVSSPGFIKYLSNKNQFLICHNVLVDELNQNFNEVSSIVSKEKQDCTITTIGAIRDFSSNLEVIQSLQNNKHYKLDFIGKGIAEEKLKKYVLNHNINNVFFHGFYDKKDEKKLLSDTVFLNIYYPDIKSHSSALSNRFYLALILKIPMIVKSKSIQGEYVEKYNLGISTDSCDNLDLKITNFLDHYDHDVFQSSCNELLEEIRNDQLFFEKKIIESIKCNN